MITASVVLFNTSNDFVKNIFDSYKPSSNRKLFLIDNSPNETYEYEGIDNVEYIYNGGKILDMVQRIISE